MRRRKIKHGESASSMKEHTTKMVLCSKCNEVEEEVEHDAISVICWKCCQKACPVDPKYLTQKTAQQQNPDSVKPRGWRFMKEFVDTDGTVYHGGEIMPELKGTLPVTDIASIKAKQKEKSKDRKAHKAEREVKKQAK